MNFKIWYCSIGGRGDWTRTSDHTAPSRAFYQLNYAPIVASITYKDGVGRMYFFTCSYCQGDTRPTELRPDYYAPYLNCTWNGSGISKYGMIVLMSDYEKQIEEIIERNKRVEGDKAWETCVMRRGFIALITYEDGEKAYIIAPQRLQPGDTVISGERVDIKPGNALPMANIPVGTIIHNVELKVGGGAQVARSAGTYVQLIGKDQGYAQLRMNSGEIRIVRAECMATIGAVSNPDKANIKLGKAGRKRWLGKRPAVRGVAMNPVDHPHGGGEGRTSGGRHPVTPWGKPTKGKRTRNNKKTDRLILRRRKR